MSWKRYFKKQSIGALVQKTSHSHQLKRSLGAFQLIMLGIGAIIGAGIFVLAGTAASQTGPAVTLSFILSGIACACVGFCYAELSSLIPVSGSAYTYIYVALGEIVAWIVAFVLIIANISLISSVADGWTGYLVALLSDFNIHIPEIFAHHAGYVIHLADGNTAIAIANLPAVFIIALMSVVLFFGIETSAILNTVIVIIKMSVLFLFIVLGIFKVNPSNWIPFIPANTGTFGHFGVSGIVGGVSIVLFAYNGFDVVATAAQETKNPQRNLPIGILGSLAICTVTYILVSLVLTGLVDYRDLNVAQPIALAVNKMGYPWFSLVAKFGALAGLTSVVLVMLYSLVRITFVSSQDGLLPSIFKKCHKKYNTPYVATFLFGAVISVITTSVSLEKLVTFTNICIMSVFVLVCTATIYLRYSQPKMERQFKCPLMPWIPGFGIFVLLAVMCSVKDKSMFIWFLGTVGVAVFVYMAYGRHHSMLQKKH